MKNAQRFQLFNTNGSLRWDLTVYQNEENYWGIRETNPCGLFSYKYDEDEDGWNSIIALSATRNAAIADFLEVEANLIHSL